MSESSPPVVEARDWGWRHSTRKAWAVRGLDLRIEPGERVLLLGASGAGKSTLLAGLAGLLDPEESGGDEEGSLLLDGVVARRARVDAVRAGQALTGLLLQDPQAQTVLARCGDDVAFGLENHAVPTSEIWPRVAKALDGVGFPYPVEHPTGRLSGGERQRLALAGVLALGPGLLLLDEPTAMLDPAGADLVRRSIATVLEMTGAGCVLVEHRVEPWLPFIDRVVVLEPGGGVFADGAPGQVFAEQASALVAAGVWVPGVRSRWRTRGTANLPGAGSGGSPLLTAEPRPAAAAASVAEPLLTAEGLAARRPGQTEPPVRDVDLTVRAGRALAVTGPNGAGKSTLALTLAGLTPPAAGSLTASGILANGAGPHPHRWRAGQLVSRIGTVFQDPQHQFVASTVAGELAVGPERAAGRRGWFGRTANPDAGGTSSARRVRGTPIEIDELLRRLRLDHLARANPYTLSGGEQRRLSVATVLATAPGVLVLDEPTFGQDARTWTELTALLLELLGEGRAVVAATHDLELVEALAGDGDTGEVLEL
ncbi:ABC transporter ATP-binding protein [Kineosporia succinea]|uniref:Energy-coupling factor transport system ATP-binding protein n=1 Tax=Kineosporia succinea TaxID=84632 RepID=A0ABT9P1M4_9ACTN|nr:ABC transporter ATP-binding protein [Kineosporia succinea]MDP9826582.1 energy-coupling factor transport system ATP-binding protein [Kineosporia succinea]